MPTIAYKTKNGTRVKGATTIKGNNVGWGKGPLMWWANDRGLEGQTLQEAYKTATVPGTLAHLLIESFLRGVQVDLGLYEAGDIDKAKIAFNNFLRWTKQFKFQPAAIEPNLVSESLMFGGTPDVIALVLGELAIVDWKTGKIYEDVLLQLVAYKHLWEENHPDQPLTGGFHVLQIPKNEDVPAFTHRYWATLPSEAWEAFECALTLNRCQKILKQYV